MISTTELLAYTIALGIAAAIPGPGMTALVARSVGSGAVAGFCMLAGLIVGDLLYLSFAVFGLSLIAQHFHGFFVVVRYAAICYLLFLAWQFWTADRQGMTSKKPLGKDLVAAAMSGLAITIGNPKTIAFYLALLPLVLDLDSVTAGVWAGLLVPLTIATLLVVGAVFILGAVSIRSWLTGAEAQKHLHRGAAFAMASAAGLMIHREL